MNRKFVNVCISIQLVCNVVAGGAFYLANKSNKEMQIQAQQLQEQINKKDSEISEANIRKTENEKVIRDQEDRIKKHEEEIEKQKKEITKLKANEKKEYPTQKIVRGISKGREISVELTGYCNCSYCSGGWGSRTAMGTRNRVGVIAMPKEIELGSKVSIPALNWYKSDNTFSVEDRGGAVVKKSNGAYVVDVWFPTHAEALKLGRVKTKAYIN